MASRNQMAAAASVVLLVVGLSAPASAADATTQAVTADLRLTELQMSVAELVEVCLDDECETVALAAGERSRLKLQLAYALAPSSHLPAIDAIVGLPSACSVENADGSNRRRVGASIAVAGADFAGDSSVQLVQGSKTIASRTKRRTSATTGKISSTNTVTARVCLL